MLRLKGQLRDRVFLRSHLRSSLTPEEGPSCLDLKCKCVKSWETFVKVKKRICRISWDQYKIRDQITI